MTISDDIDRAYRKLESAICSYERDTGRNYTLALIPHNTEEEVRISLNGKPVSSTVATAERVIEVAFIERAGSSEG